MKKSNYMQIIVSSIFLIVFNAVFFVTGGAERKTSVWISYAFIHFSYFMILLTPYLYRKGNKSAIFGFSLYFISSVYFAIEFIIGVIFILVALSGYKAALLTQLCAAGLYGIIFVADIMTNDRTSEAEEDRQNQIAYIRDASGKIKILLTKIADENIRKRIERVYDVIISSPAKSDPSISHIETNILQAIYDLEYAVFAGDRDRAIALADSIYAMATERNIRLKA